MTFSPLGAYLPGTSPLHRLRPGAKLLGLFGIATLSIIFRSVPSALIVLAIGVSLALLAGLRPRELWRLTRRFAIVAVILFAFQWWQNGWEHGLAVVGTLFGLLLLASAVTASTAADDTVETITWALGPFRRFGAKPERVALAFSLVLRTIPTLLGVARETRDAARARGLERSPRAYLVPMALRTVAHAQHTGEALHARGVIDD
ncbi:energy-coupling factor transporter transmembrane component T family protein [Leucobacter sp. GX24907]